MITVEDQDRLERWLWERLPSINTRKNDLGAYIGNEIDGRLVGVVGYTGYTEGLKKIWAHIAGEGTGWLTREFLWFMFAYPFVQLELDRIFCSIRPSNRKSIQLCQKLGFKQVGVLKVHGIVCEFYRMKKEECRFLDLKVRFK